MSPKPRQAKRVQPAKKIERQGVALLAKTVADMGHLWNEPQNDFGTDGYIELVDPATEKATNRVVLVQSKATSVSFGDRPVGFTCDEDDLRYWLHGNAPVVLVRSHPSSGEAFWVSVKDYFAEHPEQRESRRILFDRERDRFDVSACDALVQLARPRVDGLYLGRPPFHETLVSNLLPVEEFPPTIYSGKAAKSTARDSMKALERVPGRWPRAWIFWSGRVYSFLDPRESAVKHLVTGEIDEIPASDWAYSEDEEVRRRFVWMLKAALHEQSRPALRGSKDLMWVAAPSQLPLEIAVPGTSNTRTLVKRYPKPDGDTRYVRHLAFEPRFVLFADQWYLEITPTYHFTRDGREPDRFASEHRSGIKRIERHNDFRRNVDSLALILRDAVDLGGLAPDGDGRHLDFGQLETATLDSATSDALDTIVGDDIVDADPETSA
jgi:Domain of unknown function (DUF4365)